MCRAPHSGQSSTLPVSTWVRLSGQSHLSRVLWLRGVDRTSPKIPHINPSVRLSLAREALWVPTALRFLESQRLRSDGLQHRTTLRHQRRMIARSPLRCTLQGRRVGGQGATSPRSGARWLTHTLLESSSKGSSDRSCH